MERRHFIKNTCIFCLGAAIPAALISACSGPGTLFKTTAVNGIVSISRSAFTDKNYLIVRPENYNYDIFIHHPSENTFDAVLMKCTHRDAPLNYTSKGLVCNDHGSRFSFEGNVIKEPATAPLKKFPVTINNEQIIINLRS